MQEFGDETRKVLVLALRNESKVDYLEQFIMGNILDELLGEASLITSAVIRNDILFLLDAGCKEKVESAAERTIQEFSRVKKAAFTAAVSEEGVLKNAQVLYQQILELFQIGEVEQKEGFLSYEVFRDSSEKYNSLVNYHKIKEAEDFAEILFELYLAHLKMELSGYKTAEKEKVYDWTLKILYGDGMTLKADHSDNIDKSVREDMDLLMRTADMIAIRQNLSPSDKEEQRMTQILCAMYQNLADPEMSLKFLAKEILFMNEEHVGRLFVKNRKVKFSAFVLEQRIRLAQKLIQFRPDILISSVAEMVGYAPDGQYFSKAFRKVTGSSPKEYKESLKEERNIRTE